MCHIICLLHAQTGSCINEFLTYRSSSENSATSSCVYTPKGHPISFKKRFFRDPKTARRAISPRTTRNLLPKCEKKNCFTQFYEKMLLAPQLSAINADPAQSWHASSTPPGGIVIQFSRFKSSISQSYGRSKLASFPYWKSDQK